MAELSSLIGRTVTTQGYTVALTLEDIDRAYIEAQAAECRLAIQGKGGYRTFWPRPRRRRRGSGPRRTPPSIRQFVFRPRYRPGRWKELRIMHRQAKGFLLETRPRIRGYDNIHYLAARTSLGREWDKMSQRASEQTARRAFARTRRRVAVQRRRGAAVVSAARTRRIGRVH